MSIYWLDNISTKQALKKCMGMFAFLVYFILTFILLIIFFGWLSLMLPFSQLNYQLTHYQIISLQAQFKNLSAVLMASFFAITTPAGIAAGVGLSTIYNPNSPRALVIEGILDSVSAGLLIYMSLVDLIAADFLGSKMTGSVRQQVTAYIALFLGAISMSSLAIWA